MASNREYKNSHKFIQSSIKVKLNNNQNKNNYKNIPIKNNYNFNFNSQKDSGTKKERKSCSIKYNKDNNEKDKVYNKVNDINLFILK